MKKQNRINDCGRVDELFTADLSTALDHAERFGRRKARETKCAVIDVLAKLDCSEVYCVVYDHRAQEFIGWQENVEQPLRRSVAPFACAELTPNEGETKFFRLS